MQNRPPQRIFSSLSLKTIACYGDGNMVLRMFAKLSGVVTTQPAYGMVSNLKMIAKVSEKFGNSKF